MGIPYTRVKLLLEAAEHYRQEDRTTRIILGGIAAKLRAGHLAEALADLDSLAVVLENPRWERVLAWEQGRWAGRGRASVRQARRQGTSLGGMDVGMGQEWMGEGLSGGQDGSAAQALDVDPEDGEGVLWRPRQD